MSLSVVTLDHRETAQVHGVRRGGQPGRRPVAPRRAGVRAAPAVERGAGRDDVVDEEDRPPVRRRAGPGTADPPCARAASGSGLGRPGQSGRAGRGTGSPLARPDRASEQLGVVEASRASVLRGGRRPGDDVDGGAGRTVARPSRRPASVTAARALRYFTRATSSRATPSYANATASRRARAASRARGAGRNVVDARVADRLRRRAAPRTRRRATRLRTAIGTCRRPYRRPGTATS